MHPEFNPARVHMCGQCNLPTLITHDTSQESKLREVVNLQDIVLLINQLRKFNCRIRKLVNIGVLSTEEVSLKVTC